jgi:hypothetical protein
LRIGWFAAIGVVVLIGVSSESALAAPAPDPEAAQKDRERIRIYLRLGQYKEALRLVKTYAGHHPEDHRAYFLEAEVYRKLGEWFHAEKTISEGLSRFPGDPDLRLAKAEILLLRKKYDEARSILLDLYRKNPRDPGIRGDLIESYEGSGLLETGSPISLNFIQATATQPPPRPGVDQLSNLSEWSFASAVYSMLYPGGAALTVDARVTTPLYGRERFFAGRTEYLGSSDALGGGTNDFTYAGAQWNMGRKTKVTFEAGDTRLHSAPGLYGRIDGGAGPLSLSVQGFGNMIWGDFGESIVQDGLESGVTVSGTVQILPRVSLGADYWYFEYSLDGGSIPYGNLHSTMGMFDIALSRLPRWDLLGGYDSWNVFANPAVASSVPILQQQSYFFMDLAFEKRYESLWTVAGAFGGYDDTVSHLASFDASLGAAYQLGPHWQFFGNAYYFNQSTIVSGATESFMGGLQLWF